MSSQDNKQLVMQGYKLYQDQNIPALLDLFADDIEWTTPESEHIPFSGAYHGKQDVAGFFSTLDQAQDMERFEPTEFIAEGDKVIVLGYAVSAVKATGRRYEAPWVHVFTIRDGKVARFEEYTDTAAAEAAYRPMQEASSSQQKGASPPH